MWLLFSDLSWFSSFCDSDLNIIQIQIILNQSMFNSVRYFIYVEFFFSVKSNVEFILIFNKVLLRFAHCNNWIVSNFAYFNCFKVFMHSWTSVSKIKLIQMQFYFAIFEAVFVIQDCPIPKWGEGCGSRERDGGGEIHMVWVSWLLNVTGHRSRSVSRCRGHHHSSSLPCWKPRNLHLFVFHSL